MYSVLDICRYIIHYSNAKGYPVSNLKLQKLLYFVQAYFLMTVSKRCFHEPIEAWAFGPVVPKAYREYVRFGACSIPDITSLTVRDENDLRNSGRKQYNDSVIADDDKDRINAVIEKFSEHSATDLVALTQSQKPWTDAYMSGLQAEITTKAIAEYFANN